MHFRWAAPLHVLSHWLSCLNALQVPVSCPLACTLYWLGWWFDSNLKLTTVWLQNHVYVAGPNQIARKRQLSLYIYYNISFSVCSPKAMTQLYARLRAPGPVLLLHLFFFLAYNVVRPSSFVSRFLFALPVLKHPCLLLRGEGDRKVI